MDDINKLIFLVGVGAPASLYTDYLEVLQKFLPQTKLFILEWWNQDDFGISTLQSYISNSDVMLIGHSAGSVIALQALAKWPALVKKIIMLDSHFLRTRNTLPTVDRMLEIMLKKVNSALQNRIKEAYAPIIENDLVFNRALKFAIDWVSESFDQACLMFNSMPAHSGLQIGFTDSSYQMLRIKDEKTLAAFWEIFNVDVKVFPMNHFDLIEKKCAAGVNQLIVEWLHL